MLLLSSGAQSAEPVKKTNAGTCFEPINKGRLGSTQEWRIEKPKRYYY